MSGRRARRWAALGLSVCLALAGCGAPLDLSVDDGEDLPPWQAAEENKGENESAAGITSFALAYDAGQTLDPMQCGDGAQLQLTSLLYETLFQLDETFQPQPLLCSGYTVSEDGLEYTLTLREGVTFSDGSLLEAGDAVDALRRAMDSQRFGSRLSDIRQVSERDGAVVITLSQPNSRLPALLDIPVAKLSSAEGAPPMGTGPYLLVTSGEGAYLAENPDWWQGLELPLERIELVDAKDSETVLYLFTSREVHLYASDLTQGNTVLSGRLETMDIPTATMQFIGINVRHPALQDQGVRRALGQGIPRETVAEGYLSGHALPAQFPVSPAAADYPGDLETAYSLETYRQAVAALWGEEERQAVELTLLVNGDNSSKTAIARYLAQSLSVDGMIQVTVEALPWAEYLQSLESGDFDLYYGEVRLSADWDAGDLIGTGGALNYGGWSAPDTDAMLEACRTGGAQELRTLCQHVKEAVPLLPVCFKSDSLLTHSGTVEHASPTSANIFYRFSDWIIHLSRPEQKISAA